MRLIFPFILGFFIFGVAGVLLYSQIKCIHNIVFNDIAFICSIICWSISIFCLTFLLILLSMFINIQLNQEKMFIEYQEHYNNLINQLEDIDYSDIKNNCCSEEYDCFAIGCGCCKFGQLHREIIEWNSNLSKRRKAIDNYEWYSVFFGDFYYKLDFIEIP